MSERARAALRALVAKWRADATSWGTCRHEWFSFDKIAELLDDDALWVEPLVAADEEALGSGISTNRFQGCQHSIEALPDTCSDCIAAALIAAGVVQIRAQVVASLAEDEALVERVWMHLGGYAEGLAASGTIHPFFRDDVQPILRALAAALAAPADSGGTE